MAGQETKPEPVFEYGSESETEDPLWVEATYAEVGSADGERITIRVPSALIERLESEGPKTRTQVEALDERGI